MDLRSTLHMHGPHLRHAPAHGLEGGVVITQLSTATQEVLLLKDGHTATLMRLGEMKNGRELMLVPCHAKMNFNREGTVRSITSLHCNRISS